MVWRSEQIPIVGMVNTRRQTRLTLKAGSEGRGHFEKQSLRLCLTHVISIIILVEALYIYNAVFFLRTALLRSERGVCVFLGLADVS